MGMLVRRVMVLIGILFALIGVPEGGRADQTCPNDRHWSNTNPAINLAHVFCGEVKSNGRAAGFHARPGGINPGSIISVEITQPANDNGIYAGMVTFAHPNGRDPVKFSSLFPDSCTYDQIVASILYAHDHRMDCPAGAPGWWQCGLNRPLNSAPADGLCIGDDPDGVFTIAIGLLRDGRINTAFPLR